MSILFADEKATALARLDFRSFLRQCEASGYAGVSIFKSVVLLGDVARSALVDPKLTAQFRDIISDSIPATACWAMFLEGEAHSKSRRLSEHFIRKSILACRALQDAGSFSFPANAAYYTKSEIETALLEVFSAGFDIPFLWLRDVAPSMHSLHAEAFYGNKDLIDPLWRIISYNAPLDQDDLSVLSFFVADTLRPVSHWYFRSFKRCLSNGPSKIATRSGTLSDVLCAPPFTFLARLASDSFHVGDDYIEAGTRILIPISILSQASASSPYEGFLAFGGGSHQCPGSTLGRVLVDSLISRSDQSRITSLSEVKKDSVALSFTDDLIVSYK